MSYDIDEKTREIRNIHWYQTFATRCSLRCKLETRYRYNGQRALTRSEIYRDGLELCECIPLRGGCAPRCYAAGEEPAKLHGSPRTAGTLNERFVAVRLLALMNPSSLSSMHNSGYETFQLNYARAGNNIAAG